MYVFINKYFKWIFKTSMQFPGLLKRLCRRHFLVPLGCDDELASDQNTIFYYVYITAMVTEVCVANDHLDGVLKMFLTCL